MSTSTLDLIQSVAKKLPIPLVGSVMYNGNKETRQVTSAAYEAFKECFDLIQPSPTKILEIGTHAGGSAAMMLAFAPHAAVVSVDIGHTWITPNKSFATWHSESHEGGLLYVEQVLKQSFGGERFALYIGDSTSPETLTYLRASNEAAPFDLAFVDGNHELSYVVRDIKMCKSLGIKTLILDDYNSDDGGEVSQAAAKEGLHLVKEWKRLHSGGVSMALLTV